MDSKSTKWISRRDKCQENPRHEEMDLSDCCQDQPNPAAKSLSFHTAQKVGIDRCRFEVQSVWDWLQYTPEYVLPSILCTGYLYRAVLEVWYTHQWLGLYSVLRTQITVLVWVCVRSTYSKYGCRPYRGATLFSWIVLYSGVIRSPPPLFYRPAAFFSLLLASYFPVFHFHFLF